MTSLGALPARTRVVDDVYGRLLQAILDHELLPGSRLSVPALATRLGISRTPVREAIIRLVREGLAHEEPRRGAVLGKFYGDDLVAIYEMREVLEGLAARLAAQRATADELDELQVAMAKHREIVAKGDVSQHFDADMHFHSIVRRAAHNPALAVTLDQVQTKVRMAMITTVVTAGPEDALADHERIFVAIMGRKPAQAEQAARRHVSRLRKLLVDHGDDRTI